MHHVDSDQDVVKALPVVPFHNGTASVLTVRAMRGFRPSAGTRSTDASRRDRSSCSQRPRVKRLTPSPTSTRRSRSLSGLSVPRATLPKTRTLVSPYFAVIRRISSRWSRTRAPMGPVRLPVAPPGSSRIRTSSSRPAAATRRASVGKDGCRAPFSYALTTLWVMPARRASSACESRARRRASRKRRPGWLSMTPNYSGLSIAKPRPPTSGGHSSSGGLRTLVCAAANGRQRSRRKSRTRRVSSTAASASNDGRLESAK